MFCFVPKKSLWSRITKFLVQKSFFQAEKTNGPLVHALTTIGRLKNYRIIKHEMPINCLPLYDDIDSLVTALTCLQDSLLFIIIEFLNILIFNTRNTIFTKPLFSVTYALNINIFKMKLFFAQVTCDTCCHITKKNRVTWYATRPWPYKILEWSLNFGLWYTYSCST